MSKNITKETNIEEDEIDLKELFLKIRKNIKKIIFFVTLVTSFAFLYVLSLPNFYKSEVILSSLGEGSSSGGGNLSSLASLAGININSKPSSSDPFLLLKTTLNDYEFNMKLIENYNLAEKLENPKNLVFAFEIDSVYKFLNKQDNKKDLRKKEEKYFQVNKKLSSIISISQDKKSSLITLKAETQDRFLAKYLVDIYLKELIDTIKVNDLKDLNKQISFYKNELQNARDVALKEQLSKSLSALLQKKVFSKANEYYFVSKLRDSRVAYIKEKTKPKRALILMVSFITSFIFAIFLVFLLEFFRNEKK